MNLNLLLGLQSLKFLHFASDQLVRVFDQEYAESCSGN